MEVRSNGEAAPEFAARHMYHPTEASRIIRSAAELKGLGPEWSAQAFPAAEPEAEGDPLSELAAAVADLAQRVEALELGVTTFPAKRKK